MPVDYSYTGIDNANDILDEVAVEPSNLETIDLAFYDFMNEEMNIHAETNKGWKKTPIIWASPERVYFSKEKKELYDVDGTLIYPLISVERSSLNKNLSKKGKYSGAPPFMMGPYHGGRIMVGRRIVQDKTNNYSIADNRKKFSSTTRTPGRQSYYPRKENKKVVVETLYIPQPTYISIDYTVTLKSNFQQQMNEMVQPFTTLGGHINSFLISRAGHSYEAFMNSDLSQDNNIGSYKDEERTYQTQVKFNVLGYLIGEGKNQDRPRVIRRENAVEVKIPRERVIVGDLQEFDPRSDFYRE